MIGGTPRAKCWARASCPVARMLTANAPASRRSSWSAAWRPTATPTSGGSRESETSETTVRPAFCPPASTVTTLTGWGTSRINAFSSSPATGRSYVAADAFTCGGTWSS